jgi:hypothetical protein
MWMSAIELSYVNVGHRAIVFCRYSKPSRAGEVLSKFLINSIIFLSFFTEKSPLKWSQSTSIVFLGVVGLPARAGKT